MHMFVFRAVGVVVVFITLSMFSSAQAAEVRVIAANAVKDGYADVVAAFERSTGHTVVTTWTGTVNATRRVSDGEVFDLVLIGSANIDQLLASAKLVAGSRADFARSGVGMAIRSGLPRPDVSTAEAIRAAVLAAQSVAYSAGPSGAYVAQMLNSMGISAAIAGKVRQPSSGAEVAALIAKGEADVGFAQVSEFLGVAGLVDLGPLPASLQNYTLYAIGLHTAAPSAEAARQLIRHLTAPEAAPAIRKMGMEPG